MRFAQLSVFACSLIATTTPARGYVSGVNARLTTAEPARAVREQTFAIREQTFPTHEQKLPVREQSKDVREHAAISQRGGFRIPAQVKEDDRIIFPTSWNERDEEQDSQQRRSSISQDGWAKKVMRQDSEIGGAHSLQLRNSFPPNRASVHPFETDDDDDRPIWRD